MNIRAASTGDFDLNRHAALSARLTSVLLCFISLLCGPAAVRSAPPEGASVPGTVREIGPMLLPRASSSPVVGQGGNYSVPLDGGGSLWLLNNVWAGEEKDAGETSLWGIVDGGAAVLDATSPWSASGRFRYVSDENGWPLPLFAADISAYSPVRKFWPRSGLRTPSGYHVFYSLMNNYGPGGGDYFRVGQGLAFSVLPAGPYAPLTFRDGYAFWNDIEPSFGSAVLADADGWIYVYGRFMPEPGKSAAALARVKPEDIGDRDGYSYYGLDASSGTWTRDITEASPVMENVPEEFSVSYNEHLKAYLAFCSGPDGGGVAVRTATYPWGPWEEPRQVLACGKDDYCFGAKEQAAFSADGGKRVFFTLEKRNRPYLYELTFE